jgi:hypothetical protein
MSLSSTRDRRGRTGINGKGINRDGQSQLRQLFNPCHLRNLRLLTPVASIPVARAKSRKRGRVPSTKQLH